MIVMLQLIFFYSQFALYLSQTSMAHKSSILLYTNGVLVLHDWRNFSPMRTTTTSCFKLQLALSARSSFINGASSIIDCNDVYVKTCQSKGFNPGGNDTKKDAAAQTYIKEGHYNKNLLLEATTYFLALLIYMLVSVFNNMSCIKKLLLPMSGTKLYFANCKGLDTALEISTLEVRPT